MTEREPIAVVGLDCRFPGARDAQEYWSLLMDGRDGTERVPEQRWDADRYHAPPPASPQSTHEARPPGRTNTVRGGFIADPDAFDPAFFGIAPREAAAMDPQQRLLLQCSWRAIEDATLAPQELAGTETGVFVGVMANEWAYLHLTDYDRITARYGSGNGYFMGANRVSYHLDLRGPSLAVDTACSSSLVAVHLAVNSLRARECDHALAAGTNLIMTPVINIFYAQAGLSAPDGRCKPFSAAADGIGRAEGVAVLVLRRLSDALADRQPVYAVLQETGINQDGRSNGITAPNRWAQQQLIESVWRRAGLTADDIRFVEAHGTGTLLGDFIEAQALGELTGGRSGGSVALGSVKSNFGHAEGAAGIAGLVKAVLALHHRTVPPSRFADDENPKLDLAGRRLSLLKSPLRLPSGTVHAAVSSFGMGGSNAHAVLATAPRAVHRSRHTAPGVFTVSARTPERLRANLLAQADALSRRPENQLAQLCWTSNRVKSRLPHRAAVAAADLPTLVAELRAAAERAGASRKVDGGRRGAPSVAFAFTGQGAQHPRMTASWYRSCPSYARHLDEIDQLLAPHTGVSVRDLVLDGDAEADRARLAQPALFAVQYAMAAALDEAGISPSSVIGHSIGEFAAACTAGALDAADAARLVARRGALMDKLPEDGGMLAVGLAATEVEPLLSGRERLGVAAVNGPHATVIAGDADQLAAVEKELAEREVSLRRLSVSHAFHSPLMRPVVEEFRRECADVSDRRPALQVYSTVYGRALTGEETLDAAYWARQITEPVRFAEAAGALLADGVTHVVEIGPRAVLTPLLARLRADGDHTVSLHSAHPGEHAPAHRPQQLFGELWCAGLTPDWSLLYAEADRVPRRLPPYLFDDSFRSWRSGGAPERAEASAPTVPPGADSPAVPSGADRGESCPPAPAAGLPDSVAALTHQLVCRVGGHDPQRVHDHDRLHEDLGFDSIRVMELKTRIEDALPQLGPLPIEDLLANLRTVADLVGHLRGRLADGAAPAAPATSEGTR
ncbi:acyltransferase domain-containing protein [Streptomyces luteolifulvus]|uniref:Acyltransferase domain-containing protein n=1 Tax=Streptomyces luteolifulvus TaxID=2615112 RepID=A0A6H9UQ32_9ACTN|nr:type I polyketide synthase [Streptomyces luteolifulvus]KAB1140656.1 acyltransferase domain-containing protein [Streptomyces luteolifulvus]